MIMHCLYSDYWANGVGMMSLIKKWDILLWMLYLDCSWFGYIEML